MICIRCGKEFTEDFRKDERGKKINPPKFCSRSCANSRPRSLKYRKKISKIMKSSPVIKRKMQEADVKKPKKICPICGIEFSIFPSKVERTIFCSRDCFLAPGAREHYTCSAGGYREGSGRAHNGYYKGIYCGSTYELVWMVYQIDHNIPFERFKGALKHKDDTYIPDFLQDGGIVEIKGYYTDNVEKQIRVAKANGFNITLKYKEDLKEEFDYVFKTYSKKQETLHSLYD